MKTTMNQITINFTVKDNFCCGKQPSNSQTPSNQLFVLVTLMIVKKIRGVKAQASRAIKLGFLTYQGCSWAWRMGALTALT